MTASDAREGMTIETLATLLAMLDTELWACRSATKVLEKWCGRPVSASRTYCDVKPLPAKWRHYLRLSPREHLAYRHVVLMAGAVALSKADNWYVPERLTTEMNDLLDRGDTPFGKAIEPLHPFRSVLSRRTLWQGASGAQYESKLHDDHGGNRPVLRYEALLMDSGGRVLSLVRETYLAQVLTAKRAGGLGL